MNKFFKTLLPSEKKRVMYKGKSRVEVCSLYLILTCILVAQL